MPANPRPRPRLDWIDSLRGLAVAAVVCHHLLVVPLAHRLHAILPYYDFGVFGVICFFAISGFIIPYSVLGLKGTPAVTFPVARLFRLYPAYWLSLLAALWAFHPAARLLLVNATMTQRFLGDKDVNGVYWTLQVELLFYLLFELLLLTRNVLRTHLYPILTVVFALTTVAMGTIRDFLNLKSPMSPPAGLTVMFLATTYFMHLNYKLWTRTRMALFAAAIVACLWLSFRLGYQRDWGYQENTARFCTMYLLGILVFLLFERLSLRNTALAFLGRISYPVYLFHVPIAALVLGRFGAHGNRTCLALDVLLTIAVATAVHYAVEKPFVRLGRQSLTAFTRRPT